jgi:4-amino-4-deoxy-L-arabinose transferase-like glycosyltransferase
MTNRTLSEPLDQPAATFDAATPRRSTAVAILFGLWLVIFFASLFAPPLLDDADATHANAARHMALTGDLVTLHVNGIRYLEKAPLPYWLDALSFRIFGFNTFAAHFPEAIGVLLLALLGFYWASSAFGNRTGFYSGLAILTSIGVFLFTRIYIPEVLLTLFLCTSLYCLLRALGSVQQSEENNRKNVISTEAKRSGETPVFFSPAIYAYAMWASLALAVLTKGLVAIVFLAGTAIVYLALTGEYKKWRALKPLTGTLLFLAIAAPWHILAGLRNPTQGHIAGIGFSHWPFTVPQPTPGNVHGWFWFYFLNEHLLRYLNLRVPRDYDTVPLWIFWGLLLVWLAPWSAWLVARSVAWTRQHQYITGTRLLLLIWAAFVMLFFSFSTRQEYYALPALPALALLIAGWLVEEESPQAITQRRTGKRIALVTLILGMLGAIAAGSFVLMTKAPGTGTDLASLLVQNPADYALSLGHFLDLNAQALGLFRLPLLLTALALAAGSLGNFLARRRNQPALGNYFLFGMMIVFLLAAQIALGTFNTVLGSERLADAIAAQHPTANDLIAIHGEYESGSTLGFYLRRNDIHIVDGRSSNLWYGSFFPDAPPIFENAQSLSAKWPGPQRIYMWNDPSDATRPLPQLSPVYVIAKSGGKEILSNQPPR